MKVLNINILENNNKTSAFTHRGFVGVVFYSDIVFDVVFSDFVCVNAIAEFYRMMCLEV